MRITEWIEICHHFLFVQFFGFPGEYLALSYHFENPGFFLILFLLHSGWNPVGFCIFVYWTHPLEHHEPSTHIHMHMHITRSHTFRTDKMIENEGKKTSKRWFGQRSNNNNIGQQQHTTLYVKDKECWRHCVVDDGDDDDDVNRYSIVFFPQPFLYRWERYDIDWRDNGMDDMKQSVWLKVAINLFFSLLMHTLDHGTFWFFFFFWETWDETCSHFWCSAFLNFRRL